MYEYIKKEDKYQLYCDINCFKDGNCYYTNSHL